MPLKIDAHGETDVGRAREKNEDQYLVADLTKSMLIRQTSLSHEDGARLYGGSRGHLFVVADGMGGHLTGEIASGVALETLARYFVAMVPWFLSVDSDDDDELKDRLARALKRCELAVQSWAEADGQPKARRMGTTLTMAYLISTELFVVHVGDSRCYVLRGSELYQITTDHTVVQQMVEQGIMESENAERSPFGSSLWQAIGGADTGIEPEVQHATLAGGDGILLCTDGLTREVSDGEIARVLSTDDSAEAMCTKLVDAANEAGGADNVTVVVCRLLEEV